ncbi:MAG: EAL domain-containing protein [Rhodocyclaceae bacterium]|nr:EAL domain-containing protein [Rhodocyclaceae bacterium]
MNESAPHTILLIEDNPGDARLVAEYLRECGREAFRLTHVTSVADAVPLIDANEADIIVLDLMLPDGEGLETLQRVHELAPRVPIVVLSHLDDEREAVKAVRLGAQDFLVKQHLSPPLFVRSLHYALERRKLEERLFYLAHHDVLTELANRKLFHDRLEQAIAWARRHRRLLALFVIDLDDFKAINDTFGHAAGDELLREVGVRLKTTLRATDQAGRLGGDEFVVYAGDLHTRADAQRVAEKLVAALSPPYRVGGKARQIQASIGVALYPEDADEPQLLFERADAAMYAAKRNDGADIHWRFFRAEEHVPSDEEAACEARLATALARGDFFLVYQPQVDLNSGRLIGVEALLRLRQDGEVVMPAVFMPALERTGLIIQVGEWALKQACREAASWMAQGLPAMKVAVNVSGRQFRDPLLPERVFEALKEAQLPGHWLELEIREESLHADEALALQQLRRLNAMGCRIAIDNFRGTRTSLRDLQRFPIHSIKIDKSLVQDGDGKTTAFVEAVISVAHVLKLRSLAEGVETADQAQRLRQGAWDGAQGFAFGQPLDAAALAAFLRTPRTTQ